MVLHDHASTTYSIVRNSILNEWTYFHVDGLVPDIMHDVLEGCVPYMVKELVKISFLNIIITLQELNDHITMFPYSLIDDQNKATVIPSATLNSSDHSVKQKGDY